MGDLHMASEAVKYMWACEAHTMQFLYPSDVCSDRVNEVKYFKRKFLEIEKTFNIAVLQL